MLLKSLAFAAVAATSLVFGSNDFPPCADNVECFTLTPPNEPNFTFNCSITRPVGVPEKTHVYFMHGNDGRYSKAMWANTMNALSDVGYTCLACDQRGYSVGAAPDEMSKYNYNYLVDDIFSIVNTSFGTSNFHLVTHDQGARVSWHGIAKGPLRERLLSFTSLSIPHSDVFSDALYGPNPTEAQQTASQYVRTLVLPNSTTVYNNAVLNKVCSGLNFKTAESCQKVLWWYNGAIDSGAMALAPFMPFGPIGKTIGIPEDVIKNLTQYNLSGVPQTVKVGNVTEFPVLYACGTKDVADLCLEKFKNQSAALIKDFSYLKTENCGHNIIETSCSDYQLFIDKIVSHIEGANAAWLQKTRAPLIKAY